MYNIYILYITNLVNNNFTSINDFSIFPELWLSFQCVIIDDGDISIMFIYIIHKVSMLYTLDSIYIFEYMYNIFKDEYETFKNCKIKVDLRSLIIFH